LSSHCREVSATAIGELGSELSGWAYLELMGPWMNCRTIEGPWVSSHIERDRNKAEGLDVDVAFVVVAFSVRLPSSRGPPNIGRSTSAVPGSGEPIACICSLRLRVQGEGVVRVIPGSVSGVFGPSLDPGDDLESRSCRPAIGGRNSPIGHWRGFSVRYRSACVGRRRLLEG
jgi:hypothetical protein